MSVDNSAPVDMPSSRINWSRVVWIGTGLLAVLLAVLLVRAVQIARDAAIASGSQGPFNQLQLALRNYHEEYGCFPPAWVADERGEPMHSWRVLILPYVDARELYQEYDFSEPWNGPNNSRLAHRMPSIFHCPSEPPSDTYTNAVVIVGPDTAFPGSHSTKLEDFEDGTDQTILLAEIAHSKIGWLEPRDLHVESMSFTANDVARPSISTSRSNGAYIVFADGIRCYSVTPELPPEVVRALTTIRGHEPLFMADVREPFRHLTSPGIKSATDADLERFPESKSVSSLWLSRTRVTDAGLKRLLRLEDLYHLDVAGTAVTDEGVAELVVPFGGLSVSR